MKKHFKNPWLFFCFMAINLNAFTQEPGYAGEWKRTRLYGHAYNSGDFTAEEYNWIRDHFEYFTFEKTHMRSLYSGPSHELTSKLAATKLIKANPRCKPLLIYSIGSGYPQFFESEAAIIKTNPEYFLYDATGAVDALNVANSGENDWYVKTVNSNTENSDLYGTFLDGYKSTYTSFPANVQYMSERITGFRLQNGMDFAPNGLTIRTWPESLNYGDGVFIDAFFRRRVMSKDAGVVLIDACMAIPKNKMFVCFSAYDGYSPTYEFSHAAYLIVAHENAYYRWVDSGDLWSSHSIMTWKDAFGKEMGAPLGKAVKKGYVYTRVFEHCTVTLDVENITSSIVWNQNNVVTGILGEDNNKTLFTIYPNPVKDMLSIELGSKENATYQVLNTAGQVILTDNINNGSASLDLSQFSKDIYMIRVSSESSTQMKKFVKE